MATYLFDGPGGAERLFVFAHGAGAPMDHSFMNTVARALGERGVRVVRFEFPYMAARRTGAKKSGAPDRQPVLLDAFRGVVGEHAGPARLFIGGKSMGGRMATMVADELGVAGVVVFGYPFHPPGAPAKLRTGHLETLRTPTLILQGERDTFGTRAEVEQYPLSKAIRLEWIPDGDHSLKPRAQSGRTLAANVGHAIETAAAFMA